MFDVCCFIMIFLSIEFIMCEYIYLEIEIVILVMMEEIVRV